MKAEAYLAIEKLVILAVGLEMQHDPNMIMAGQVANSIATDLLDTLTESPEERTAAVESILVSVRSHMAGAGIEGVMVVSYDAAKRDAEAIIEKCKGVKP